MKNKHKLPPGIETSVAAALVEDVGAGDLTASLVPANKLAAAQVIARENAVVCGCAWFDAVFRQLDSTIRIEWDVADGARVKPEQRLCRLQGPARPMLTGERTALNFLQTLSGTATLVRQYVDAIQGTNARILDTRKTLPGLRAAQKYAVLCGGGENHRQGLYDAVLIKENHIAAAGSIGAAVKAARNLRHSVPIQVEAENLDEVREALHAGVDMILLDNFPNDLLVKAVSLAKSLSTQDGRPELEASGNINLENVRSVAETGVDRISIGSLTKNLQAIDLSMRFEI
jgi:nicotinate-nucleotide pyrophosphorylase (carboxylating)